MRWMNLEPIIQSEISQKEKNNGLILMRIYGIWEDGTDESICRAAMETQTLRRTCGPGWWRRGKGGRHRDSSMETYIIMCKLDSQWEFAVYVYVYVYLAYVYHLVYHVLRSTQQQSLVVLQNSLIEKAAAIHFL